MTLSSPLSSCLLFCRAGSTKATSCLASEAAASAVFLAVLSVGSALTVASAVANAAASNMIRGSSCMISRFAL